MKTVYMLDAHVLRYHLSATKALTEGTMNDFAELVGYRQAYEQGEASEIIASNARKRKLEEFVLDHCVVVHKAIAEGNQNFINQSKTLKVIEQEHWDAIPFHTTDVGFRPVNQITDEELTALSERYVRLAVIEWIELISAFTAIENIMLLPAQPSVDGSTAPSDIRGACLPAGFPSDKFPCKRAMVHTVPLGEYIDKILWWESCCLLEWPDVPPALRVDKLRQWAEEAATEKGESVSFDVWVEICSFCELGRQRADIFRMEAFEERRFGEYMWLAGGKNIGKIVPVSKGIVPGLLRIRRIGNGDPGEKCETTMDLITVSP